MSVSNKSEPLNLRLGFSPCPNDTFMFDALVHQKINTEGLHFEVLMEDVETLNQKAINGELEISKVSFAAFMQVADQYQLLHAGSALGKGVGPLVVSLPSDERSIVGSKSVFNDWNFAIPGKNTTANFLFSLFFPDAKNKMEMIFSQIEGAVLSGVADAGIIIHENRFTYEQKGLKKICDLGELWERETGLPIPLGGIAVKRNLPEDTRQKIDRVMRRSVEYAFANPEASQEYVKEHAQEMDEAIRKKHINTYVNDFSMDLGEKGMNAIQVLFQKAKEVGMIQSIPQAIFVKQESITI